MTTRNRRNGTLLIIATLSVSAPLFAEMKIYSTAPGRAFSPERSNVDVQDVPSGRSFRGEAHQLVYLRGTVQVPASAEPKLTKLVVHFRTSEGPRLRSVELPNSSIRLRTDITGDYATRETLTPDFIANAWMFPGYNVSQTLTVRLGVQFSGGIDSIVDPGEFVLTSVVAEFPLKPSAIRSGVVETRQGGTELMRPSPSAPVGRGAVSPVRPGR